MTVKSTPEMKMNMTRKQTNIRQRIFSVFFVILLLSFSLTGIIFNIIVRQYIQITAGSQLEDIYKNILQYLDSERIQRIFHDDVPAYPVNPENSHSVPIPVRRTSIRININAFVVDDRYNLLNSMENSDVIHEILQVLKSANRNINALRNILIKTGSDAYYVSAFRAAGNSAAENRYFIVYADVTGLLFFGTIINTFLVILVCVLFFISIIVTFFLSKSITNPIQKLGLFAARIGQGDFTPANLAFMDVELENLNMALNNSARQLSIYDSEQKKFFQNVSHELRTPLMSIQCQAEGILYGIMDSREASGTILEETRRLSDLVSELLYISKLDNITGVYETEKTDLPELLRSCAQRQQSVAEREGIHFSFDFSDSALEYVCAGKLISRAIDNLISNAIRYASSEIIISCAKNQNKIRISVADDGEGIKQENLPYIFERFYKTPGGNYGIGLSIVKSIVEQHHGTITAENREKGGAVFTITLPPETGS